MIHLFWYCECVQSLWQSLLDLHNMKNINFDMNMSDILLGTSASQLVNFIYLITKQFIYFCRCKNTKQTFEKLLERISIVRNIEYRIAILQNSLIKHNKKWAVFE